MRILVVEDEPLISMMLQDYLEIMDMEVVAISDCVSSALGVIAGTSFDAAIVDVNLAGGETCADVVSELERREIPFILSSGDYGPASPWHGFPMMPKPYTLSDVETAMDGLKARMHSANV